MKTVSESIKEIIDENAEDLNRHEYIILEIVVIAGEADRLDYTIQKKKKR